MDSHRTRTSVDTHKFLHKSGRSDSLRHGGSEKVKTPCCTQRAGTKAHLKDISEGLTTSKELLKILDYTWELDERSGTTKSLVAALKCELEETQAKVGKLIQEQQVKESKIDCLMKKFAKERFTWKTKEQERIQNAVKSIARELEVEKKLKGQFERLNRKLGKELAITKASLFTIEEAFDSANTKSTKSNKQVQKTRQMFDVANISREARVQMKLSEAKCSVVDKLPSALETCFIGRIGENIITSANYNKINELIESYRKGDDTEIEDSIDSDLQSIEFNMDNNCRTYEWSYAAASRNEDFEDEIQRCNMIKDPRHRIVSGS
ncbi:hypothetical protein POM88_013492 [Heracleum sosnowskyi]|uniref:Uncharacterized protein n=1 Tax=Heracleum sosnowskyi TaxID=360622 RepID=A0AAD8J156_9APIA|nr:hypothetical protein POM88_013492 [Heracleum sosnowskyi]